METVACSPGGGAGSFEWFCTSANLQALYEKVVPQFVFEAHHLRGKVHLQYLLRLTGDISWHQPAKSILGLQSWHGSESHQQVAAASQKSGEVLGNNQRSPTPAKEVSWLSTDTALLPGRGVCGKLCSQTPSHAPQVTTLCYFKLCFWSREAIAGHSLLFCVLPWHWKFPLELLWGALVALKPARSLSKGEPGECIDCPQ